MAVPATEVFSFHNPVFKAYLFYNCLLVLKMMFMSLLTGSKRMKYKVFSNPEDAVTTKGKVRVDENVERVRRAHLNDLENIPLFFVSAFVYTMTNPAEYIAKTLFLAYSVARFAHTFVYAIMVIPQPARALAWLVGYGITGYMAITGLLHFL